MTIDSEKHASGSLSLENRIPAPPAEVVIWMERFGGEEGEIADRAMKALAAALERPGRSRDGAYALLAADGLLTYAVEDTALAPDPELALRELIEKVVGAS